MPTFCVILTALLLVAVAVWFGYVKPLMKDGRIARVIKEQEDEIKARRAREELGAQKAREETKALTLSVLRILDDIVEGRCDEAKSKWDPFLERHRAKHPGAALLHSLRTVPEKVANLEEHRSNTMKRYKDMQTQVAEVHAALKPYA